MSFKHDIPLADRYGQLVNNEFAADVFFEVGSGKRLMYGHRSILSIGSPVFNAQLNGHFTEAKRNSRQHPIVVTDVEGGIFLQILRYIYSEKVVLSHHNAVDLYYASQKYLLAGLSRNCEDYFYNSLCSENVVQVFNDNRRHEFQIVNDCCLEIICDNPLVIFTGDNLIALLKESLELIVVSPKINCSEDQLLDAVSEWGNAHKNEDSYQLLRMILTQKHRTLKCKKLHSFDSYCTATKPEIFLCIESDRKVAIYGIGVYVGCPDLEGYDVHILTYAQVIRSNRNGYQSHYGLTKTVIKDELYVQEIIFEKITVSQSEKCVIFGCIKVPDCPTAPLFCMRQFNPYNLPKNGMLRVRDFTNDGFSCAAYVLYNVL